LRFGTVLFPHRQRLLRIPLLRAPTDSEQRAPPAQARCWRTHLNICGAPLRGRALAELFDRRKRGDVAGLGAAHGGRRRGRGGRSPGGPLPAARTTERLSRRPCGSSMYAQRCAF
jgi:hypothetical protein